MAGIRAVVESIKGYAGAILRSVLFWVMVVPAAIASAWDLYIEPNVAAAKGLHALIPQQAALILLTLSVVLGGFQAYHRLRMAQARDPTETTPIITMSHSGDMTIAGTPSRDVVEVAARAWAGTIELNYRSSRAVLPAAPLGSDESAGPTREASYQPPVESRVPPESQLPDPSSRSPEGTASFESE